MKKENIYKILIIAAVALLLLGLILHLTNNKKENISLNTKSEIKDMIKKVYKNTKTDLPSLETHEIDLENNDQVTTYTGLKDNSDIELVIASEPQISSQAYTFAVIKVKEGSNIEKIKQNMYDNLNMSKWLCVTADKLYITSYDNTIIYVMASSDWAEPVYNSFKEYTGNTGKELEKTSSDDYELPPEIILD